MRARVPLDVDLQDRLMYGLTPVRFGCAVAGLVGALTSWQSLPAPAVVRACLAIATLAVGTVLAWMRPAGRPVDAWVQDWIRFVLRNYRLEFHHPRLPWSLRIQRRAGDPPVRRDRRGRPAVSQLWLLKRVASRVARQSTVPGRAALASGARVFPWISLPFRRAGSALAWLVEPLWA